MNTPDARLDLRRRQRLGMVEAVWGEHKTADQIIDILESFSAAGELGLVTRVAPEKAARVCEALPAVELHAGDLPRLAVLKARALVLRQLLALAERRIKLSQGETVVVQQGGHRRRDTV